MLLSGRRLPLHSLTERWARVSLGDLHKTISYRARNSCTVADTQHAHVAQGQCPQAPAVQQFTHSQGAHMSFFRSQKSAAGTRALLSTSALQPTLLLRLSMRLPWIRMQPLPRSRATLLT